MLSWKRIEAIEARLGIGNTLPTYSIMTRGQLAGLLGMSRDKVPMLESPPPGVPCIVFTIPPEYKDKHSDG